jgi:hypothetical protein
LYTYRRYTTVVLDVVYLFISLTYMYSSCVLTVRIQNTTENGICKCRSCLFLCYKYIFWRQYFLLQGNICQLLKHIQRITLQMCSVLHYGIPLVSDKILFIIIFSGSAAQRVLWPPRSRGFLITHYAPESVGLLWTSEQLVAETSVWQHTTHTTDKH